MFNADDVNEDEWFGKLALNNFLDSLEPLGNEDYRRGWNDLAAYIKLEFNKRRGVKK